MKYNFNLNKQELNKFIKANKLSKQYLPMLNLKQEELELELHKTNNNIQELEKKIDLLFNELSPYLCCLADPVFPYLDKLIVIDQIIIEQKNVAGIDIPTLIAIQFKNIDHKYFYTPSWVLFIKSHIYKYAEACMRLLLLKKEQEIINKELKKNTHKLNLYHKVMIPYNQTAIKKIKTALDNKKIYAMAIAKIAKKLIPHE